MLGCDTLDTVVEVVLCGGALGGAGAVCVVLDCISYGAISSCRCSGLGETSKEGSDVAVMS